MKNKNKLIYASAIIISLAFGFYLGNIIEAKKNVKPDDVYKSGEVEKKSLDDDFLYPLFVYNKKEYYFYNLPEDIQKRLIRERIEYYRKMKDILMSLL